MDSYRLHLRLVSKSWADTGRLKMSLWYLVSKVCPINVDADVKKYLEYLHHQGEDIRGWRGLDVVDVRYLHSRRLPT